MNQDGIDFSNPMLGTADTIKFYSGIGSEPRMPAPLAPNSGFQFAPTMKPMEFCEDVRKSGGDKHKVLDFKKGTTTLGFKFNGGIILACDSRASMGQFIASEDVWKIIEINPYLCGTMAGGAADC